MKKGSFKSLSQWWDVGKVNIKMLCQNYTSFSTTMLKETVQSLQRHIELLEKRIMDSSDTTQGDGLTKKKIQELSSLLQEQAKGALIRARSCSIKDMEAPSTFFFNLETKSVQQKTMCHLCRPDGSITSDPAEMRRPVSNFYRQLYSAESCDAESAEDLLKVLPQILQTQKQELDRTISLQELTEAMSQLSKG
ncbi:mucin-5B-like [Tachysurus ichikawai]